MGTVADSHLKLISAVAVRAEMQELLPRFKRLHGIDVDGDYDVNPAVARRVMAGEPFDVGLTNPRYVGEMISSGRVVRDVHVPFGRVPLAIGAAGSRQEDIAGSREAVRALLLGARSIGYVSTGTSGETFLRAIEQMGIEALLRGRMHAMGAGEPAIAAANGQVQYAVAPLSRILASPGIAPAAIFPPELGLDIDLSMFVHASTVTRERAMQLIRFLSDPTLDDYLQSHGIRRYRL